MTPEKTDHIEAAITEALLKMPQIKDMVASRTLAILNDHMGSELKKSEIQIAAKELAELQSGKTESA